MLPTVVILPSTRCVTHLYVQGSIADFLTWIRLCALCGIFVLFATYRLMFKKLAAEIKKLPQ